MSFAQTLMHYKLGHHPMGGKFFPDLGDFLRGPWAERAAGLGWDAGCLFACHPGRPLDHLQGAGLLWRIGGGKIVGMYSDWAVIEINGERQVVHRRPTPANFVELSPNLGDGRGQAAAA
jgi:hypothetical protein